MKRLRAGIGISFVFSFLIHGVIIVTLICIRLFAAPTVPKKRPLTIDFTLVCPSSPSPSALSMAQAVPPKAATSKVRKPAPSPVKEDEVNPDTTKEDSITGSVELVDGTSGDKEVQPVRMATVDSGGAAGPGSREKNTAMSSEVLREQYLREQFEYIRRIIYRKAVYPDVAAEMNITGTVFLSFCVREDGGVEGIDIVNGSGAQILDRDAVSTVRRAAPFPKPPVSVVVKFPFEYRMD